MRFFVRRPASSNQNDRRAREARRLTPRLQALEERRLLTITVQLDYRFDTSGFFTPAVRALMQQAANNDVADLGVSLQAITPSGGNTWSEVFQDLSAGINHSIDNPTVPANTLVVYVFGAPLPAGGEAGDGMSGGFSAGSTTGDENWFNTVASRGLPGALSANPTAFGTWGGAIAFDTAHTNWYFGQSLSGISSNQTDFLTVAEHEMGHVLGIGTSGAWQTNIANGVFVGPASKAAHSGQPVPLAPGLDHWAEGTVSDGHPATMDPVLLEGTRDAFTTLDYAALQDLGWNLQNPVLQFSQPSYSTSDKAGTVTITVNRTGGQGPATINYATSNGSAKAGVDYTATSGTLTFAVGDTSQSFTIPILNDPNSQGPLTVNVSLSSPTAGALIGTQSGAALTINPVSTSPAPSAPTLSAQDDTGTSTTDGITRNNGSASAPLNFTVSNVSPANGFVRLFDNGTLIAGPVQASSGTASFSVSGSPLPDGVHQFTVTAALTASGDQSPASSATNVTIETSLHITNSTIANGSVVPSLPNGQIVLTFSHPLAGLIADQPSSHGFASDPFAVMLIPSGPDGGALAAANAPSLWTGPSGVDSGDLPINATLVYHVNANGTSQITLTPAFPLSSDIYLIAAQGLSDLAGNPLTDATTGTLQPVYLSFDFHASPATSAPLQVLGITANRGTTVINNNLIPQPDTIAIQFNRPVNTWTVNSNTIQLLANTGPGGAYQQVTAPVYLSPSTNSAYLTPADTLSPGTVYLISVSGSVSDDQNFPGPGVTLGQNRYTTFEVNAPAVGVGTSPLTATTNPQDHTAFFGNLGYGAVTFSEPIQRSSLGRFSAMLIPQTGGATTGNSGYSDVPMNAKVVFNPNTNQLIMIPTQMAGNSVYLFSLSGISASLNSDTLTPPGGPAVYATFQLVTNAGAMSQAAQASTNAALTTLSRPSITALDGPAPTPDTSSQTVAPPQRRRVVAQSKGAVRQPIELLSRERQKIAWRPTDRA